MSCPFKPNIFQACLLMFHALIAIVENNLVSEVFDSTGAVFDEFKIRLGKSPLQVFKCLPLKSEPSVFQLESNFCFYISGE